MSDVAAAVGWFLELFINVFIIVSIIALVYAAGRWAKRQVDGAAGDWVEAKLVGWWRRFL